MRSAIKTKYPNYPVSRDKSDPYRHRKTANVSFLLLLPYSSKKSWKPERNPYDVLGVAENASMKDIENAYQSFHNAFLVDRPQLDELRLRYAQAQLAEKKKAFKFLMNRECQ